MQTFSSIETAQVRGAYLAIGSFDGVHLGHRSLLDAMTRAAHIAGAPAAVITFFPHPRLVLGNDATFRYLTTIEDRLCLFAQLEMDAAIVQPFDLALANLSAVEFMERILRHIHPAALWVGDGFTLGHQREGDIPFLRKFGRRVGFAVQVVPPLALLDAPVSSSRIRTALTAGDVKTASVLMGRRYSLTGEVIHGDGRGKLLGTPTANLLPPPLSMIPANGIYATRSMVQDKWHGSVTNIGVRPSFVTSHPKESTIETYLLDFQESVYGKNMRLEFTYRLRDELRFAKLSALQAQIQEDIVNARRIWEEQP
jgi:riboflavin kinase / FMN adenylyltransferase